MIINCPRNLVHDPVATSGIRQAGLLAVKIVHTCQMRHFMLDNTSIKAVLDVYLTLLTPKLRPVG